MMRRSAAPTISGSYSIASGSRRRSASAVVLLPIPNGPFSQTITSEGRQQSLAHPPDPRRVAELLPAQVDAVEAGLGPGTQLVGDLRGGADEAALGDQLFGVAAGQAVAQLGVVAAEDDGGHQGPAERA